MPMSYTIENQSSMIPPAPWLAENQSTVTPAALWLAWQQRISQPWHQLHSCLASQHRITLVWHQLHWFLPSITPVQFFMMVYIHRIILFLNKRVAFLSRFHRRFFKKYCEQTGLLFIRQNHRNVFLFLRYKTYIIYACL